MIISELMEILKNIKEREGDIEVQVFTAYQVGVVGYDDEGEYENIAQVRVDRLLQNSERPTVLIT